MKEGDVLLAPLPQADGLTKNRPVLLLRELPRFRDLLLCGISTQHWVAIPAFDDTILPDDADFGRSGLVAASVIRLGFLAILPRTPVIGAIGSVSPERHARLLEVLAAYLVERRRQGA